MKYIVLLLLLFPLVVRAKKNDNPRVQFETTKGRFVVELFNDTPIHRDNFLKLVKEGYYNGMLFHRVIADFMIQGGDPNTKDSRHDITTFGEGGPGYTLPAEIFSKKQDTTSTKLPLHYHLRGALAMAREGDEVNPQRRSSGSQFYVVWGKTFDEAALHKIWQYNQQQVEGLTAMPNDIQQQYKTLGGTPHLDGQYTVFGRVVKGLSVIEDINHVDTYKENDCPIDDVMIIKAKVL